MHAVISWLMFATLSRVTLAQCTTSSNDTCFIDGSTFSTNTIQCAHSKCIVSCSSDSSCESSQIICPLNAEYCIINCNAHQSCQSAQIIAASSKYTEINIGASDAGKEMIIYAPGSNDGVLHINVSNNSDFYDSVIYAQSKSSKLNINCNDANLCSNNTIHGHDINESIMFSCYGPNVDCSHTNIYCSSHSAPCNMKCSLCQHTNMYTNHGISDVDWQCINNPLSCTHSKIYCGLNQNEYYTKLLFSDSVWFYEDSNICKTSEPTTLPTLDPTNNPTLDTSFPTVLPTSIPSNIPSVSPTIHTIHPTPKPTDLYVIFDSSAQQTTHSTDMQNGFKTTTVTVDMNINHIFAQWDVIYMNPLYFLLIILIFSLCCMVCIIAYWMYTQHQMKNQILECRKEMIHLAEKQVLTQANNSSNIAPSSGSLFPVTISQSPDSIPSIPAPVPNVVELQSAKRTATVLPPPPPKMQKQHEAQTYIEMQTKEIIESQEQIECKQAEIQTKHKRTVSVSINSLCVGPPSTKRSSTPQQYPYRIYPYSFPYYTEVEDVAIGPFRYLAQRHQNQFTPPPGAGVKRVFHHGMEVREASNSINPSALNSLPDERSHPASATQLDIVLSDIDLQ